MEEVLFERRGAAGIITLNRPSVLNALNYDMIKSLRAALDDWANDAEIGVVVVLGAGSRAFSPAAISAPFMNPP